ncbi:hypothetical protein [Paenibacillus taichungensis]|uniref:hypothetical protein n=1 Tax=Paenibacillus taichungensis TaxID=484184 RepID=UPI0038D18B6E
MAHYLKVNKGTEQWRVIHHQFTYHEKWFKYNDQISNFLGWDVKTEFGLYMNIDVLTLEREHLKKYRHEWIEQFKKNSTPAEAKMKSQVNKSWINLCKELGLEVARFIDVRISTALLNECINVHELEDYYIEIHSEKVFLPNNYKWGEEVDALSFLKLQSDHIETKKLQSA